MHQNQCGYLKVCLYAQSKGSATANAENVVLQQDFEDLHKLSKDEDIDPCLNHMTSFLALN